MGYLIVLVENPAFDSRAIPPSLPWVLCYTGSLGVSARSALASQSFPSHGLAIVTVPGFTTG